MIFIITIYTQKIMRCIGVTFCRYILRVFVWYIQLHKYIHRYINTGWQEVIGSPQNLFLCNSYKNFMNIGWKPYLLAFKRSILHFGIFHTAREITIFVTLVADITQKLKCFYLFNFLQSYAFLVQGHIYLIICKKKSKKGHWRPKKVL